MLGGEEEVDEDAEDVDEDEVSVLVPDSGRSGDGANGVDRGRVRALCTSGDDLSRADDMNDSELVTRPD